MRAFAMGVCVLVGCGAPQERPAQAMGEAAQAYERQVARCDAGSDDACLQASLAVEPCRDGGAGELCDYLRREGRLPNEPPPVAEIFGCWEGAAAEPGGAVFCIAEDGVALRTVGLGWDRWAVAGIQRHDGEVAAYHVGTNVHSLMVSFPPTGPYLTIEGTFVATRIVRSEVRVPDALPSIEQVCAWKDACRLALVREREMAEGELEGPEFERLQRDSVSGCHCAPMELWWTRAWAEPLPAECQGPAPYEVGVVVGCGRSG